MGVKAAEGSGGSGDLLADMIVALIAQMIESSADKAHGLARRANFATVFNENTGLIYGPYHPNHTTDPRGRQ